MEQGTAGFLHGSREVACCCAVDEFGGGFVAFGLVDVGVGCAVDDYLYVALLHGALYCGFVGDVKLGDVGEDVVVG